MINIFLASVLTITTYLMLGSFIEKYLFKTNNKNYAEQSIFGLVFLSFFSLIFNFFIPVNKYVGSLFFLIAILYLIKLIFFKNNKIRVIKFLLLSSILTFILIALQNVNRPDAGLYHLPFISIINENKIILGLANLHFRFGHISILQYLSAINSNFFFSTASITLPPAAIAGIFFIYIIKKIFEFLKKKKLFSFFAFLTAVYCLYSFSNFSKYGNDAPSHIFLFILIIQILDIDNIKRIPLSKFYKISYLSIFLFAIKTFMVIVFLFPLILFCFVKLKKLVFKNKNFIIILLFLLTWVIKNILVSGCIIYPLTSSCLSSLKYYDSQTTKQIHIESEAWSKGWIDQKKLNHKDYIKNFKWFKTWKDVHFKIIIIKVSPFLFFLTLLTLFLILRKMLIKKELKIYQINGRIFFIFILSLLFSILWFLKFPLYRYGQSFIALFIITFYLLFITKIFKLIDLENIIFLKKLYKVFIIVFLIIFTGKNVLRIASKYNVTYNDYPWPKIYSFSNNDLNYKKIFSKIYIKNNMVYYFSDGELCMYGNVPCSHYFIKDLKIDKIYTYYIYYK